MGGPQGLRPLGLPAGAGATSPARRVYALFWGKRSPTNPSHAPGAFPFPLVPASPARYESPSPSPVPFPPLPSRSIVLWPPHWPPQPHACALKRENPPPPPASFGVTAACFVTTRDCVPTVHPSAGDRFCGHPCDLPFRRPSASLFPPPHLPHSVAGLNALPKGRKAMLTALRLVLQRKVPAMQAEVQRLELYRHSTLKNSLADFIPALKQLGQGVESVCSRLSEKLGTVPKPAELEAEEVWLAHHRTGVKGCCMRKKRDRCSESCGGKGCV